MRTSTHAMSMSMSMCMTISHAFDTARRPCVRVRVQTAASMQPMTKEMFDLVYNSLSFTLASMMASTIFFWLRVGSIDEKYKSAMTITGLVTFIAACAPRGPQHTPHSAHHPHTM